MLMIFHLSCESSPPKKRLNCWWVWVFSHRMRNLHAADKAVSQSRWSGRQDSHDIGIKKITGRGPGPVRTSSSSCSVFVTGIHVAAGVKKRFLKAGFISLFTTWAHPKHVKRFSFFSVTMMNLWRLLEWRGSKWALKHKNESKLDQETQENWE